MSRGGRHRENIHLFPDFLSGKDRIYSSWLLTYCKVTKGNETALAQSNPVNYSSVSFFFFSPESQNKEDSSMANYEIQAQKMTSYSPVNLIFPYSPMSSLSLSCPLAP